MSLQLIIVVETNEECKSDWIYIKDTIEHFYQYDQAKTKFTPIYMDGKGKYKTKEKKIRTAISQYAYSNKENQSIVIYFFDCDKYDTQPQDERFLTEAKQYCDTKGYDFVWFCRDIEQVYLGESIEKKQKKDAAKAFKTKKAIKNIDKRKLLSNNYVVKTSNILKVFDKYLSRK